VKVRDIIADRQNIKGPFYPEAAPSAYYRFENTFTAEHVALMENVISAVTSNRNGRPMPTYNELVKLEVYRREHGLS
jgi:hypothetical protein